MGLLSRVKTWSAGETLTASDLNAEFDNILNNLDPDNIEDASADATAMQATADPYPGSSESLATNLRGEIQRLRYLIKQITGKSQWYIDPATDIDSLNTLTAQATTSARGTVELATAAEVVQWSSTTLANTPGAMGAFVSRAYIWIPASAFVSRETNGAQWKRVEFATYASNWGAWAFDGVSGEYIQTQIVMPEQWNRSTWWGKVYWAPASGASQGDGVVFHGDYEARADDEAIDDQISNSAFVWTDTVSAGTNGDLHITPAASSGPSDSPQNSEILDFFIVRDVNHASDTMAEDAYFFGVFFQIGLSNTIAVWS